MYGFHPLVNNKTSADHTEKRSYPGQLRALQRQLSTFYGKINPWIHICFSVTSKLVIRHLFFFHIRIDLAIKIFHKTLSGELKLQLFIRPDKSLSVIHFSGNSYYFPTV